MKPVWLLLVLSLQTSDDAHNDVIGITKGETVTHEPDTENVTVYANASCVQPLAPGTEVRPTDATVPLSLKDDLLKPGPPRVSIVFAMTEQFAPA